MAGRGSIRIWEILWKDWNDPPPPKPYRLCVCLCSLTSLLLWVISPVTMTEGQQCTNCAMTMQRMFKLLFSRCLELACTVQQKRVFPPPFQVTTYSLSLKNKITSFRLCSHLSSLSLLSSFQLYKEPPVIFKRIQFPAASEFARRNILWVTVLQFTAERVRRFV